MKCCADRQNCDTRMPRLQNHVEVQNRKCSSTRCAVATSAHPFLPLTQLTHQVDVYARWVDAFMELQADPGLATGGDAAGEHFWQCCCVRRSLLKLVFVDGLADFRGGEGSGSERDDGEDI